MLMFRDIAVSNVKKPVRSGESKIYNIILDNYDGDRRYLQLYDNIDSDVTVGATVPVKSIPVPAYGSTILDYPNGLDFKNGITIAVTTTNNGSAAPTNAALVCIDHN